MASGLRDPPSFLLLSVASFLGCRDTARIRALCRSVRSTLLSSPGLAWLRSARCGNAASPSPPRCCGWRALPRWPGLSRRADHQCPAGGSVCAQERPHECGRCGCRLCCACCDWIFCDGCEATTPASSGTGRGAIALIRGGGTSCAVCGRTECLLVVSGCAGRGPGGEHHIVCARHLDQCSLCFRIASPVGCLACRLNQFAGDRCSVCASFLGQACRVSRCGACGDGLCCNCAVAAVENCAGSGCEEVVCRACWESQRDATCARPACAPPSSATAVRQQPEALLRGRQDDEDDEGQQQKESAEAERLVHRIAARPLCSNCALACSSCGELLTMPCQFVPKGCVTACSAPGCGYRCCLTCRLGSPDSAPSSSWLFCTECCRLWCEEHLAGRSCPAGCRPRHAQRDGPNAAGERDLDV